MKYFKMLGLAVVAALAFAVFANANPELFAGDQGSSSPALALGVLFISVNTLGATALRLGKSRQYGLITSTTHCRATAITTNSNVTNTVTKPIVQLSNSQYYREAPPILARAC